jgi:nitrate reductase NapAB chaperone NapD
MKETPEHIEAFEYYYSIPNRNLRAVAQKFNKSLTAVNNWNKAFNWQQRVEQRDLANAKEIEKKTNKTIVNTKADYRAEIKTQLGILKAILNQAINDIKEKRIIKVANTNELKDVVNSYEKLSKLDLLMMGEATDRTEDISINFKDE